MSDPSDAPTQYPTERGGIAPGARIGGRYVIVRLLGRGGMGAVWAVHDLELDEHVALKTLEAPRDGAMVERFRREVRLARRVTHRNVARIFDIGEADGVHYLTMEWVEGESLSSRIAAGRLPRAQLLAFALQIAEGLAAAHAAGVVHRDLKPGNVLVDRSGRAVITDFGIAHASLGGAQLTLDGGGLLGTPAYMAPEQVRGDAVDARTDIYAFGVMLYELATGRLPFDGDSAVAVAVARLTSEPEDPRRTPGVDGDVAELTLACLARDPDERITTADEIVARLTELGAATSTHARPAASITRPATRLATTSAGRDTKAQTASTDTPSVYVSTRIGDQAVAVMPFRFRGANEDAYLAEALTEEIIDLLSRNRGLRVSARGATLKFGTDADPRAAGAELGVDVVIDGAVARVGEAIRIQARLVAVDTGFQLWSGRFDGRMVDVFDLQDRIASQIAEVLRVQIQTMTDRHAVPEEAVALYLRARSSMGTFFLGGVGPDGAAALLDRVLELAPTFRPAIAARAVVCERLWFSPVARNGISWRERAEAAIARALADAPDMPETHLAAARHAMQRADYGEAARAIARSLAIAPTFAAAHEVLGALQCEAARTDEGMRHLRLSHTLDPTLVNGRIYEVRYHEMRGRPDLADAILNELAAMPTDAAAAIVSTRMRIAAWRRDDATVAELTKNLAGTGISGTSLRGLGRLFLREVDPTEVLSALEKGLDDDIGPRFQTLGRQLAAEMCALIDERELALRMLRTATEIALVDLDWLDHCPALAGLRDLPEFRQLRGVVAARADAVWLSG